MENVNRAFLLGYAYAMGIRYGKARWTAMDDAESGKVQSRDGAGRYVYEGRGYAKGQAKKHHLENIDVDAEIEKLSPEAREKTKSISIDPTRDNILPGLDKETLEKLGRPDKPVLLKKNIISKNMARHSEVDESLARLVIGKSLYEPDTVLKGSLKNPEYFNFVSRLQDDQHTIVLLDMQETKDNYEIVNFHFLGDAELERKSKRGVLMKNKSPQK